MIRAVNEENLHICAVCYRNIKNDNVAARKIDDFWGCSSRCINKLLKEKKMWTSKEWDELGKMQALYEERKRMEIDKARMIAS